jgi:hypothetical protein
MGTGMGVVSVACYNGLADAATKAQAVVYP